MKVRAAILKAKSVSEKGAWKLITGNSRMPKNAFPVGGGSPVVFARNWHWRVDRLTSDDGEVYRLLTAYSDRLEEFRAWFAAEFGKSITLLARYEFHGSHPGWHCHAPCGEIESGDMGALRIRDCLRIPPGKGFHRDDEFDITSQDRALARSFGFFRVAVKGDLL